MTYDITDYATGRLAAIGNVSQIEINSLVGRTGVDLVQGRFFQLNNDRANDLGGKRTNFWSKAAYATNFRASDSEAIVGVSKLGVRQRIEGGTIRPTAGRHYLTIPARAEAYGRRARDFFNLTVWYSRSGRPIALVEADASLLTKSRKKANKGQLVASGSTGGGVMFWLVPEVVQQADPTVLPTPDQFAAGIILALNNFFDRIAERNQGAQ